MEGVVIIMEEQTMEEGRGAEFEVYAARFKDFVQAADELDVSLADTLETALGLLGSTYGVGPSVRDGGPRKATRIPTPEIEAELEKLTASGVRGYQQAKFVREFIKSGNAAKATARSGLSVNTFYRWVYADEEFEDLLRRCGWKPRGKTV